MDIIEKKLSINKDIEISDETKGFVLNKDETKVSSTFDEPKGFVLNIEQNKEFRSIHCPESIKEDEMSSVISNPEQYIEVNIIKKTRLVDTFYIKGDTAEISYKKKKYIIDEECVFLLPSKTDKFIPTIFFAEDEKHPKSFKQTNKGITGKALSLLYMKQLYVNLIYSEQLKYNFFIVLLSIITLIVFAVGLYLMLFYDTGKEAVDVSIAPAVSSIKMWFL